MKDLDIQKKKKFTQPNNLGNPKTFAQGQFPLQLSINQGWKSLYEVTY